MQQLFSFISLFKSVQHVSGDKFAHPQEYFLTEYTAFGTMSCNSKLQLKVFWHVGRDGSHVKIFLIIIYHNSALYQKLYKQSNSAPEDGRICPPKNIGLI